MHRGDLLTKRCHHEQLKDVLQAIYDGARRFTHVQYKANLDGARTKRFLDLLERNELISFRWKGRYVLIEITKKGIGYLEYFHEALEIFNNLDRIP